MANERGIGSETVRLSGQLLMSADEERSGGWVVGNRITFEPPSSHFRQKASVVNGWILPGLVDAHCHIGLGPEGASDAAMSERQAIANREAGALLLRDAGSPTDTRWIADRSDLPTLLRAGRHIARSRGYSKGVAHEVEPEGLVACMAREAKRGDGWVKLVGDWIDRVAGDLTPCWPPAALSAGIAAAHAEGARVTAHCFSERSLPDLVEAGIDCIEHATGLSQETIPLLADSGVAIVPTLININRFPAIADQAEAKYPTYARHLRGLHARRRSTVLSAFEAGIPIFAGTDAGPHIGHGLVAKEVLELIASGIPTLSALSAATWAARSWLGHKGLSEGAPADLVVFEEDPRATPAVLGWPSLVMLNGRVVFSR